MSAHEIHNEIFLKEYIAVLTRFHAINSQPQIQQHISDEQKKFSWQKPLPFYQGFIQGIISCLTHSYVSLTSNIDCNREEAQIIGINIIAGLISDNLRLHEETEEAKQYDSLATEAQYIKVRNQMEKYCSRFKIKPRMPAPNELWDIRGIDKRQAFYQGYVKASVLFVRASKKSESVSECEYQMLIHVGLVTAKFFRAFFHQTQPEAQHLSSQPIVYRKQEPVQRVEQTQYSEQRQTHNPEGGNHSDRGNMPDNRALAQSKCSFADTVLVLIIVVIVIGILRAIF